MKTLVLATILIGLATVFFMNSNVKDVRLTRYTVDPTKISVSGLSSGAFFASQFHVAHSKNIMGAAIFAGGPYLCAQGSLSTATISCMSSFMPVDLNSIQSKAQTFATSGQVDSLDHLKGNKVFLYSGSSDSVVTPPVVKNAESLYRTWGSSVSTKYDIQGEHAMPTTNYGNPCTFQGTPYINNCNYDGAYSALSHIYGLLEPPVPQVTSNLIKFDQSAYTQFGSSMHATGYIYVPTACQNGEECALHVVFHGCAQTLDDISTKYVTQTGYNEVAENNNIIILYPQAKKSTLYPSNPNGCWDWWGYTDSGLISNLNYVTKDAVQITAVWDMIVDVSGI